MYWEKILYFLTAFLPRLIDSHRRACWERGTGLQGISCPSERAPGFLHASGWGTHLRASMEVARGSHIAKAEIGFRTVLRPSSNEAGCCSRSEALLPGKVVLWSSPITPSPAHHHAPILASSGQVYCLDILWGFFHWIPFISVNIFTAPHIQSK